MKRNDICPVARDIKKLTIAVSDVTVRCAVKAVATYAVAAIELVRQRVKISVVGQRLMKRRVEDGGLRQSCAEDFTRRLDALDVRRIVQRSQVDAILYPAQYFVRDEDRMREAFAAMHDAMADGVDISDALDRVDTGTFRTGPSNDEFDSRARISQRRS